MLIFSHPKSHENFLLLNKIGYSEIAFFEIRFYDKSMNQNNLQYARLPIFAANKSYLMYSLWFISNLWQLHQAVDSLLSGTALDF